MKKSLIIGIIFLAASLCLLGYVELKNNKIEKNRINIHNITNSGAKNENINVYLNASFIAGNIANYQHDDNNSFYVVFGDEVQYIVYMKNSYAKKINKYLLDNPEKTYRIVGVTKKIPSEMEKYGQEFVKNWLDTNHHHEENEVHSHEISKEEFYEYFGFVYLDNNTKTNHSFDILEKICYLLGIVGIVLLFSGLKKKIW